MTKPPLSFPSPLFLQFCSLPSLTEVRGITLGKILELKMLVSEFYNTLDINIIKFCPPNSLFFVPDDICDTCYIAGMHLDVPEETVANSALVENRPPQE